MKAVIRRIVSDPSCVDDLLQESLVKALRTGRRFATPGDALSFLSRIVINTTIDHYRKNRKRHYFGTAERQDQYLESRPETRSESDPLRLLLLREKSHLDAAVLAEIERALGRLPSRQREAIELVFGEHDRPLKEICSDRGIPYSTVRSRMLRGVDLLRSHLRKRGFYSDDE